MPSCRKLALDLLATITLKVVPFHTHAPFRVVSLALKGGRLAVKHPVYII
jgi:hypothetical protein